MQWEEIIETYPLRDPELLSSFGSVFAYGFHFRQEILSGSSEERVL